MQYAVRARACMRPQTPSSAHEKMKAFVDPHALIASSDPGISFLRPRNLDEKVRTVALVQCSRCGHRTLGVIG